MVDMDTSILTNSITEKGKQRGKRILFSCTEIAVVNRNGAEIRQKASALLNIVAVIFITSVRTISESLSGYLAFHSMQQKLELRRIPTNFTPVEAIMYARRQETRDQMHQCYKNYLPKSTIISNIESSNYIDPAQHDTAICT
ncbi:hypothetical protein DINM_003501 [Dirofilaria immitis]|nr:hypothetical protein [Dirofilaria immitis]